MLLLVENIVNFSMLRLVADIFGKCIAKYEKTLKKKSSYFCFRFVRHLVFKRVGQVL